MKKLIVITFALFSMASSLTAQISKGDFFVTTSFLGGRSFGASGNVLDIAFGDQSSFYLNSGGGYFLIDNLALVGDMGFSFAEDYNSFVLDAGVRYYFAEVGPGVFYGSGLFGFDKVKDIDAVFGLQLGGGYAIFLTSNIAIEPQLKLDIPFKDGYNVSFHMGGSFSIYF